MTQLLLYHARFLSPSARHFLLRPFSHCSLKLCLLFIFLKCVLSANSQLLFIYFCQLCFYVFFFFPHQDCAVQLSCLLMCSICASSIYLCGLQSQPLLSLLILPFVLFHPISLPPAVAEDDKPPYTVTRLPWTRAAVWSE